MLVSLFNAVHARRARESETARDDQDPYKSHAAAIRSTTSRDIGARSNEKSNDRTFEIIRHLVEIFLRFASTFAVIDLLTSRIRSTKIPRELARSRVCKKG